MGKRSSLFLHVVLSLKLTPAVLLILIIFASLFTTLIFVDEGAGKEVKEQKNPCANAELTIKIIPLVNKTFGYDILIYGKPLIHQPSIPGLPGNEGFTTKKGSADRSRLCRKEDKEQ